MPYSKSDNEFVEFNVIINNFNHSTNILTVVAKIIRTLVFSPAKTIDNISLHFQTFILPLIVIIQWDLSDNSQCSTQRSDLIIIQSVWKDMKKQNKLRQTKSRRTVATSPRCFKKPTCKATVLLKVLGTCVKMLQNEDAVKNNVINRFSLSINFY